jgi:hypothetical protein
MDEMLYGGEKLSYKPRKDPSKPSTPSKLMKKITNLFGSKKKSVNGSHCSAMASPSPAERQMKEMDDCFTVFNWELPDQIPMSLPATTILPSSASPELAEVIGVTLPAVRKASITVETQN